MGHVAPTSGYDVTQRDNLYRRQSGIYVLRFIVPSRYRDLLGQREIHISTRTTDRTAAKAVACRFQIHWHSCLSELELSGSKSVGSRHFLEGKGQISISELSRESGMSVELLLREVLNNNLPCFYLACLKPGFLVENLYEVDREVDGGFVIDDAMRVGEPHTFDCYLKPFSANRVLNEIIEHGFCEEVVFWMGEAQRAAIFDFPGVRLTASTILISKLQAKRLVHTPGTATISASAPTSAPASTLNRPGYRGGSTF